MSLFQRLFFGLSLSLVPLVMTAEAANLKIVGPLQTDPGIGCSISLSGDIVKGDAKKLRDFIEDKKSSGRITRSISLKEQLVVCLQSDGGAYLEAFAIAETFKRQMITTRINPGEHCLSACAIAFMGGRSDQGAYSEISRYIHPTSKLGFHAPLIQVPRGQYTQEFVEMTHTEAIRATGLLTTMAEELRLSKHLVRNMLNSEGSQFFFVKQIKDLAFMDILLYGYNPPPKNDNARQSLCGNLWSRRWDSYNDLFKFEDAKLNVPNSQFGKNGKVLSFFPFDGDAYCDTIFDSEWGGGLLDEAVVSELTDFSDVTASMKIAAWGRLPFSTNISDIKHGSARDFQPTR